MTAIIGIALIRVYQLLVSPLLHSIGLVSSGCRFYPTCSDYTIDIIRSDGFLKGVKGGIIRIFHCHPWSDGNLNPSSERKRASKNS